MYSDYFCGQFFSGFNLSEFNTIANVYLLSLFVVESQFNCLLSGTYHCEWFGVKIHFLCHSFNLP